MVDKQSGGDDLNKAMADAVRAVESREGGDNTDDKPKSAGEAITESLLKAKAELEEVLKQTQAEAQSLRDKWLRSAADLENYKKRAVKEREDVVKFGNERILRDLLPTVDDLDRVVASAEASGSSPQTTAIVDGIKMVSKKFLDQLEKHGVATFEAVGQPFDPNMHEAVQQVASDKPVGTVVSQMQRGFTLSGRLLRPALVTVSLGDSGSSKS